MMHAPSPPGASPFADASLRYRLDDFSDSWIIPEEPVPESAWHDGCLELVKALLSLWVQRTARDAAVFRDIAVLAKRERPRVGFNPDVCLVEPAPPEANVLESLRLWEHTTPRWAFEAVSPNHPYKDYAVVPEKCAIVGVEELVVFDPLLAGPRARGGPWLLQLWRRAADGTFERVQAGSAPVRSAVLDAWLIPDATARRLTVAGREDGSDRWLTAAEHAHAEADTARAEADLARAEADLARAEAEHAREAERLARAAEADALARVRALEAELARKR
jgi:hypothetical protein